MATRKKTTNGKKRTLRKTTRRSMDTSTKNKKRTAARKKKKISINILRSSGGKEKFEVDRMTQRTGRSGVPFMMARDIAKNIAKEITSEAKDSTKEEKTLSAGTIRKMIAEELRNRNEQAKASSYAGEMPENTLRDNAALKIGRQYTSPMGSADTHQHEAYRADRDSVLHDQSKRHQSST
jgi:hypothetical protein